MMCTLCVSADEVNVKAKLTPRLTRVLGWVSDTAASLMVF